MADTIINFIATTLRLSTPLIFASLGGLISERAGVVNIALEGLMTLSAFFSITMTLLTGSLTIGIISGIIAAVLGSLLHAFLSINLKSNQVISGVAINMFSTALTGFLLFQIFHTNGQTNGIASMPYPREFFYKIPLIGKLLGQLNWFIFLAIIMTIVATYVLFKTPFGLRLRAVGEYPKSADTVGVNVTKMKYIALILAGVLAGLGGIYLAMDARLFREGMIAGKGYIALAAVIFGNWKPKGSFFACIVFGAAEALSILAQAFGWNIPLEFYYALPYLLTMLALAGFVGKTTAPAALGEVYEKGQR
ncbi:ABC transporter permease [Clostridium bornimense]|uniref:ABC transporter permease n=1 Tax=Clostridium bornimense TaxID=1216932 RepID=UPI001C1056E8|nr:ABC transporter permease [Clostridium bornimense]MBU5315972.1 ABC transporter permease [Clostridium bornimense]